MKRIPLLKVKSALVTGANNKIGKAIEIALEDYGANAVENYVTHTEADDEVVLQILVMVAILLLQAVNSF